MCMLQGKLTQTIWFPQTTANPHPWESISMDFIEQLPTLEGHTAILVIVDHLTKQSLFIPTHDSIDSLELARLFLTHIFSKHGMPSHVTSNQGLEFISHFFQSLGKLLQMELHFMSGYHPEADEHRSPVPPLKIGDQVYIKAKYFRTT